MVIESVCKRSWEAVNRLYLVLIIESSRLGVGYMQFPLLTAHLSCILLIIAEFLIQQRFLLCHTRTFVAATRVFGCLAAFLQTPVWVNVVNINPG